MCRGGSWATRLPVRLPTEATASSTPAPELQRLSHRLPVVVVGGGRGRSSGCDYVLSAGDVGVAQAVEHLWGLGHRTIAYIHGEQMPSAGLRLSGYRDAAHRLGFTDRTVVVHDDYIEESGARATRMLLGAADFPTAIVAGNDHAAMGVVHTLLRSGIKVPKHVSVTGFDDSRISQLSYVQLTTVHQDGGELARAAVAAAVGRIGGRTSQVDTLIKPALVIRQTTGPARRRALSTRQLRPA